MDRKGLGKSAEDRFKAYIEALAAALGHADRFAPLRAYCTGLILPGERKSIERWLPGAECTAAVRSRAKS